MYIEYYTYNMEDTQFYKTAGCAPVRAAAVARGRRVSGAYSIPIVVFRLTGLVEQR
ncbi:hypothetical protein CLOSTMETH_01805 [[Clostridium] methylpentosum DSM 5476]|uniref:Uncharacterized protein n=1 Tax=[Clostridium] methylpentosum DSM 5476 TaxID=537013 RepID=C0ED79_9FIRM|nr:hypothetical protein CLOSTMETH_01805 [[Clostridium] methylpentosum DSM 5476]